MNRQGRILVGCVALALAVAGVRADILVRTDGTKSDGTLVSEKPTEILWQPDGSTTPAPIQRDAVSRVVLTDAHGALRAPATTSQPATAPAARWNVPAEPAAPPKLKPVAGPTYYMIPLHGEVGATFLSSALEKSLADAAERKPTVVVLDINSPGGLVEEAKSLTKVLHTFNKQLRIVALTDQDLSAAAVVTLSVREIYVKSSSTIGAATSYRPDKLNLPPKLEEKMQSAWRAVARNSAQEGGHESLLANAMIDNDMELHVEKVDGKPVVKEGPGDQMLCKKGKILTLTSHEAVDCGLAAGMADDIGELGAALKFKDWTECKGLGTVLAEYLPKRSEAFDAEKKKLVAALEKDLQEAIANDPAAGASMRQVVIHHGMAPMTPIYQPQIYQPPIPQPYRPNIPGMPRQPYIPRPYIPQPPIMQPTGPSTVETIVTTDTSHWKEHSLACVLALHQVEADMSAMVSLCEAFGHQGSAEAIRESSASLGEVRAKIYDERNKYGEGKAGPPATSRPAGATAERPVRPARPAPPVDSLTLDEAQNMLAAPDKAGSVRAARWLASAPLDAKAQKQIVALLKPFLDDAEPRNRVPYIEALAQWGGKDEVPLLVDILEKPEAVTGLPHEMWCWGPAMRGLVRLDAAKAEELILKRRSIFFWRVHVIEDLKKVAASDAPEKDTAARLIKLADNK